MDVISSRQLAELLEVSEATVKRWADAGAIRCYRTPGGHRKFRPEDVVEFLKSKNYQISPSILAFIKNTTTTTTTTEQSEQTEQAETIEQTKQVSHRVAHEIIHQFRDLLLSGDTDSVVSMVARQRLTGLSLEEIFDTIATPALYDVGDRWARGVLTSAHEHLASQTMIESLIRVRNFLDKPTINRGRAILACLDSEQHDIALRMASLILLSMGFKTVLLGAQTPIPDLALLLASDHPRLLVISASECSSPNALEQGLSTLEEIARGSSTKIFVGGHGFRQIHKRLPESVVAINSFVQLRQSLTQAFPE